jgi:hypothetical protein
VALVGGLAGGPQLAPGPLGEPGHAHRLQHAVGRAQLLASLAAAAFPAQPFPVQQVRPRVIDAEPGLAEAGDRLAVQLLGRPPLAQQGRTPRLGPQRPVGAAGTGQLGEPAIGPGRGLDHPGAGSGLDHLDE